MTSDELQRVKKLMSEGSSPQYPKAFVSHGTQDHAFVDRFATDLRANGVDAWFSKWEIKPGDSIRQKIEEGLEECEYFIIVLSKNSINRPWVQRELDAATVRHIGGKVRKIIPIKIEDCGDLPPTLASLCWEDFSNQPYGAALKRVLDSIFGVDVRPPLGKPSARPVSKTSMPTPVSVRRRTATQFPISALATKVFVDQLKSEGFDASGDVYNGQVGIIVGPKGLDRKRMPQSEIGIFFPLWELNYGANRPLVEERRFHDIVEGRPKDWLFNRPYQQSVPDPPNLRRWNRSVSLLGNRDLERSIQQELTSRFPQTTIPVNIDVIGSQGNTWAMVQVNDFETGIDEKVKAIPEDFLGRGGIMAAVVAAAESVILELQKAGRLPLANSWRIGMKRILRSAVRGYLDDQRFVEIPPGEIVEPTSIVISGKVRVHWSGSTEGMGFVMIDEIELESCSIPA